MHLKDKVVLVTGSSTGIGKDTAVIFAKKGAKVVVTYHSGKKEGEAVLKECKKHGDALLVELDVRKDVSIKKALAAIVKKFKKLDVLVNNAGVIKWKPFKEQTPEDIAFQVDTNLTGLMKMTSYAFPLLEKQKEAVIVNIASGAGKRGHPELTAYCATKFGVRGFTQTLALELPKHMRAYAVNPGATATKMTDFQGIDPKIVANIIVKTAEEKYGKKSGDDVDVWELPEELGAD